MRKDLGASQTCTPPCPVWRSYGDHRRSGAHSDPRGQTKRRSISVHTETRPPGSPSPHKSPGSSYAASPASRAPTASLRDGASATLDTADPTQRPAGCERTGGEQVEPTSHRPCQIRARCSGARRCTAGSHGESNATPPQWSRPIIAGQGPFAEVVAGEGFEPSKAKPTDLQSAPPEAEACNYGTDHIARARIGHG